LLLRDLQKATSNFTTILGQGSFGPVYKAVMATGEVVAVKVLASDSRQGEREFQTEVALLSRLHHRNLVNLVGYCVEKGQRILIYEYMSNGSLARLLYGDNKRSLSWQERLQIAHDISHGIEYLHEGVR
jgi:serine/threonine protein kinase